jgi:hypothetical protein
VVENQKGIPTRSAIDVKNRITPPDIVGLRGDKAAIVLGMTASEPLFREPKEQPRDPANLELATVPGHAVVYVRWLVQGQAPYAVSVRSIKGGTHSRTSP